MYRENIYSVIEKTGERINTLIVPKNSGLKGYAWKVLKEAGLDLNEASEISKGELKAKGLRVFLRRGEDIPQLVMDEFKSGSVVLGITGDDLFDEYKLKEPQNSLRVENTYDWFDEAARFLRPTLCLLGRASDISLPNDARVATNSKYEFTSRDYIKRATAFSGTPKITIYSGDLESTVSAEQNDCCIDTVYSGKSIDENGLKIIQKIRFSDIVAISPLKSEESLYGRIRNAEMARLYERLKNPTESQTSMWLKDPDLSTRKLMEEALEVTKAAFGISGVLVGEIADLEHKIGIIMTQKGISLDMLAKEIASRQK